MAMTIRTKLWAGFVLMMIVTAAASGVGWFMAGRVTASGSNMDGYTAAMTVRNDLAAARQCVNDFLIHPAAASVSEFDTHMVARTNDAQPLHRDAVGEEARQLEELQDLAGKYATAFHDLAALRTQRGLTQNDGLEGQLRTAVHAIEKITTDQGMAELTASMLMCRRHEKDYLLRGDEAYVKKIEDEIAHFDAVATQFGVASDVHASLTKGWDDYHRAFMAIVDVNKKIDARHAELTELTPQLAAAADAIVTARTEKIHAAQNRVVTMMTEARVALLVIAVISVIVGLGVATLCTRAILRPLHRLLARMQDIARGEGDLTLRVEVKNHDELGQLGLAFNEFVDKVHDTIFETASVCREVAAASAQVAASAEEMANGLRQQTEQGAQVAAAVEELSSTVTKVAQQCDTATAGAQKAGQRAEEGGTVVRQTVEGIQDLAQVVGGSAQAITNVGNRGQEIGKIVEVINDIADQTNLLALNAAIEAARAGEQGRGFAVVADEVRKLADRTTQATGEVAQSIRQMQSETQRAVEQSNAGRTKAQGGVSLARQAGQSLELIVQDAHEVMTMIQGVTAMTQEQATAAQHISRNLESITTANQQSALGADQSAKAAALLSNQAETLQRLVGQFKVRQSDARSAFAKAAA